MSTDASKSPFAQIVPKEATDIVLPQFDAPSDMFKPGGSTPFLQSLYRYIRSQSLDISTEKGRDCVRSLAYQITRTKTGGIKIADALMEGMKKQIAAITAEKKYFVAEIEKIHHEVRDPLTAFENRDKERTGAHEMKLGEIFDSCLFIGTPTLDQIRQRLAKIEGYASLDWEEFGPRAMSAVEQARPALAAMLERAEKTEADRIELEELRRVKAERDQIEHDERIRSEAVQEERQRAAMAPTATEPVKNGASKVAVELKIIAAFSQIVDEDQAANLVEMIKAGRVPQLKILY
jgi:hypothetical protein